jgi:5-methylcytosine-specific restriction enzyme B
VHPSEIEFRRRWHAAHVERFMADSAAVADGQEAHAGFLRSAEEALRNLDTLRRTGDAGAFRAASQAWAVKPGTLAFNGFAGQMLLNQLVKHSEDSAQVGLLLADCLSVPRNPDEAEAKLRRMVEHIESIRVGGQPAPRSAGFLLSYFWALADPSWPVLWSSAGIYIEFVTGAALPASPSERYRAYLELVRQVDEDSERFERVAVWWDRTKPAVVDHVLVDRCAFAAHPDGMEHDDLARNAAALVRVARNLRELAPDVEAATGRPLQARTPGPDWKEGRPRADTWVDWTDGRAAPGIRVWVNDRGMAVGLKPGLVRPGWYEEALREIERHPVAGYELLSARGGSGGRDVGFTGSSGEFLFGRWYDSGQLDDLDLRSELTKAATELRPVLEALITQATGREAPTTDERDPLVPLAAEFRAWGYPRPSDDTNRADQKQLADLLADGAVQDADFTEVKKIWTQPRYGSPGPQAMLNKAVQTAETVDRLLESIQHLCWSRGDDADRIDEVLADPKWKVSGLGESVIMKLLALTHPERYLAVYPYVGDHGKKRFLQLLGLEEPQSPSRGRIQVDANDRIRKRLEPLFPSDPWGMSQFLYWYAAREEKQPFVEAEAETDPLEDLAEELLLDRAFLEDLVELLKDRGQIILYGPPGTGKTYIAKKLAEALVPDRKRRTIVQFHPSTSYEDFVEGYRPEETDGQMSYRLVDGPLRAMAEKSKESPGTRHVMLIDEINRGNLPKILGELLFLLEYRDEKISTLYRPDESFELPSDLWFIGTMNTADRSVALIDAALRRRFHFVPVYPDSGPLEGLLERWLERHGEPAWVALLVSMVNAELVDALGGPHLQIGPSHFMRPGLDEARVRRIWRYNVEPLLEDQFFGDAGQIARFRFDTAYKRALSQAGIEGAGQVEEIGADAAEAAE